MPAARLNRIAATVSLTIAATLLAGQVQRKVMTAKGETVDIPVPHPLSWWTEDPLRLDASGDLMIGQRAKGGEIVTAKDYRVSQEITRLGTITGIPIVQELESWVQRTDAECHASGGLGTVYAKYEIRKGAAIPISVRFEPEKQQ